MDKKSNTTEIKLAKELSKQYRVPVIDLKPKDVDKSVLKVITTDIAYKYQIFPVKKKGRCLVLAMVNPGNTSAIDEVKFTTGFEVEPVIITQSTMYKLLKEFY